MVMTDPIADMLTRIRNASLQRHATVEIPLSGLKADIAKIMKESGLISDYKIEGEGIQKHICVFLRYAREDTPIITGIKRISKPGRRVYAAKDEVLKIMGGIGVTILSTSKGVLTDRDAKKMGVGGEVLCSIW